MARGRRSMPVSHAVRRAHRHARHGAPPPLRSDVASSRVVSARSTNYLYPSRMPPRRFTESFMALTERYGAAARERRPSRECRPSRRCAARHSRRRGSTR
eukprot:6210225-Pleurochrysis_carterae.AAC.6